ncbi:unnamed protein product [Durusdinium trenchii]|uniref:Uncharacterized protein n=1 Tax=Durusdinium trenchii TaxID=1381693 RepID=A0ABP0MVX2_9DINO
MHNGSSSGAKSIPPGCARFHGTVSMAIMTSLRIPAPVAMTWPCVHRCEGTKER